MTKRRVPGHLPHDKACAETLVSPRAGHDHFHLGVVGPPKLKAWRSLLNQLCLAILEEPDLRGEKKE